MLTVDRMISPVGRRVDESSPYVDARLLDGSRVNVIIPPLVPRCPTVTIRKFRPDKYSMEDLIAIGTLTQPVADFLQACVQLRLNTVISGGTGTGKTTLLNALSAYIPARERIITVEDPIEYLHNSKMALVNQREVGYDTHAFKKALKYILRQDPDVVLLGELRDVETIETALTIAETGHLCFATLHTNSCVQTINRIVDVFPADQQQQVRAQLSFILEGVLSQLLIPRADGKGRVVALEIMVPNAAIRNLIREDKIHQIYSQMQVGQGKFGMQTMNQSLMSLYSRRLISMEEALGRSQEPDELRQMLVNAGALRTGAPAGRTM